MLHTTEHAQENTHNLNARSATGQGKIIFLSRTNILRALGHRCFRVPVGFIHIRGTLFYHGETETGGEEGVKMVLGLVATNGVCSLLMPRRVLNTVVCHVGGLAGVYPSSCICPQQYKEIAWHLLIRLDG